MSNIVIREFEEHLARIHEAHSSHPEDEIHALYLLSLEREQIVTSHYAGAALHGRIRSLQAPEAVRELIHHAMRWAARDEDMHTVFTRGVLLQRGAWLLAFRAVLQQTGGLIAGWSSAVSQHVSFTRAPFSRTFASFISYAGLLLGKVPRSARRTLSHQSFREFASFNAQAEETAAMSWERVATLYTQTDPKAHEATTALCLRVANDERKHGAVFRILADMFAPDDTLTPEVTAERITAQLSAIDPVFVPRSASTEEHKVGTGMDVHVLHNPDAKSPQLLQQAIVDTGLLDCALAGRKNPRVVIKTEFMMSYDRRDRTAMVDPALIEALCELLHSRGAADIVVLESGNLFDKHFQHRSVHEVAEYMDMRFPHARLVDSATDQVPHVYRRGLGQNSISRAWRDADVRISLAKMRTHPCFLVHFTLANLETLGQRIDEVLFADRLADSSTGLMMALDEFPCHLALLDATRDVADGLTGILGTAHPRHPGRLYASEDAVALDWVATRHVGISNLPRASSGAVALDWFGDNRARTRVIGVDTPISPFTHGHKGDIRVFLSALAYPVYVYLSGGGSLWLPKMDPTTFPPVRNAPFWTRAARAFLRTVFRFGSPPPKLN